MIIKKTILFLLILSLFVGCASVKTGLFRGVFAIFGGRMYRARFIALYNPKFVNSTEVGYLADKEEVIGIYFNGIAKAYPLTMSFHHHIFNDAIGDKQVLVTFCPLTHTAMIFDPIIDGQRALKFTVEGGLKESNMIMVDDSTKTHWIQVMGGAVKGDLEGRRLERLFGLHTTWAVWKQLHPETLVLSRDTGFDYDYSRFPFQDKYFKYKNGKRFLFKVSHQDDRFTQKKLY